MTDATPPSAENVIKRRADAMKTIRLTAAQATVRFLAPSR